MNYYYTDEKMMKQRTYKQDVYTYYIIYYELWYICYKVLLSKIMYYQCTRSSSVLSPSYYDGSALQKCYVRNVFAPVRARVCNQRIIAHSFQSLGRHKFSGSSLLCALPKKAAELEAYTYTRAHTLLYRCICVHT